MDTRGHGTHWARIKKNVQKLLGPFSKMGPNRGKKLKYWPSKFWKIQRGDPSMSKKFSSRILLKFYVAYPHAIRILIFEFHQNRRQKFFWRRRVPPLKKIILKKPKGGPFYFKKIFVSDFAQISCVNSSGYKDFKFWVSLESETKTFSS